jgi:UDP-N-acetylglucosamine--N-acetylmuramyl-(pentapeptide) pyrophosphoryl-undecaprenol N-acetylglucosamine transferase
MEMRSRIPDSKILFVGAGKELEKKLIPRAGFHLVNITMSGLRRGFSPKDIIQNMKTIKNLATASVESAKLLRRFKPDAVIGTGGYICYPVMRKAARMGIPTFLHEPNAHPGLTVRMLSMFVDKVLVTFSGLEKYYRRPERVVISGTPLRDGFYADRTEEKAQRDRPLVVSFWGSLGAGRMNEMMTEFIRLNVEEKLFYHVHATGKNCMPDMRNRLKKHGVSEVGAPYTDLREYIDDMPSVLKLADIVISRAGASTIAELAALGKPAIFIPSPNVTENHQEVNAKRVLDAGGAVMILESSCTGKGLYETVSSLIEDKGKLEKMSMAQKSLSVPDAAMKIAGIVLERQR